MRDRPTPETDAETNYCDAMPNMPWVDAEVSRHLERERDEAQKELSSIYAWIERNHPDGFIDSLTFHQNLERVGDRWYDRLDIVERERDEAMEQITKLRDIAEEMFFYVQHTVIQEKFRAELDQLKEGAK